MNVFLATTFIFHTLTSIRLSLIVETFVAESKKVVQQNIVYRIAYNGGLKDHKWAQKFTEIYLRLMTSSMGTPSSLTFDGGIGGWLGDICFTKFAVVGLFFNIYVCHGFRTRCMAMWNFVTVNAAKVQIICNNQEWISNSTRVRRKRGNDDVSIRLTYLNDLSPSLPWWRSRRDCKRVADFHHRTLRTFWRCRRNLQKNRMQWVVSMLLRAHELRNAF